MILLGTKAAHQRKITAEQEGKPVLSADGARDSKELPSDWFDLICGTSMGGLIVLSGSMPHFSHL